MKKLFALLCMMNILLVQGADYAQSVEKGAKAYKAKQYAEALEHYTAAHQAAKTADLRFRILPVQITLYMLLKKNAELQAFLERERQDDSYSDYQLRYLLNWNARILIWPQRDLHLAMDLLQMARMLPAETHTNFYFETFQMMGEILFRQKQYDLLIYYLAPLLEIEKLHPSNRYKTCMAIGRAYRAKGDRKTALDYFHQALAAGKQVPYKYNYFEAQKYIKELSK